MKKLTGYIGAMVIVFALMGSILAGYALNISGATVTVDNYEKVTDVSGLYNYTDEKSYIEYNPASNYTGYSLEYTQTHYDSSTPNTPYHYKRVSSGTVTITASSDPVVTVNGAVQGTAGTALFACDYFYIEKTATTPRVTITPNGTITNSGNVSSTITITISSNGDTNISYDGKSATYNNVKINLAWWSSSDFDYYLCFNSTNYPAYYFYTDNIENVLSFGILSPTTWGVIMGTIGYKSFIFGSSTIAYRTYEDGANYQTTTVSGLIKGNGNFGSWTVRYMGNPPIQTATLTPFWTFYPKGADTGEPDGYGISYDTTNRVNNYPMREQGDITTTYGGIYQLDNLSLSNNLSPDINQYMGMVIYHNDGPISYTTTGGNSRLVTDLYVSMPHNAYYSITNYVKNYKLSDILNLQTIPANTYSIKMTAGEFTAQYATLPVFDDSNTFNIDFSTNTAFFNTNDWVDMDNNTYGTGKILMGNLEYNKKDYIIYNVNDGTVDFYYYNGVKYKTASYDNCYVGLLDIDVYDVLNDGRYYVFGDVSINNGAVWINKANYMTYPPGGQSYNAMRLYASINFVYYSSSAGVQYMDVGQGVTISNTTNDPDNGMITVWSNGYENGDIQILFRGDSGQRIDTVNVCGHSFRMIYTSAGLFNVTYDNTATVTIGKWRNILMDFNLENKTVIAYPVKTFNSFTNVILYDTPVVIGTFDDFAPVSTISWNAHNNATGQLKFGIYSTSVFLDTYDIVMVDPELNITQYYTDLNGFYKLNLYNFAVYGDSITINNVTYPVTNGTIEIDDENIRLKDMEIIYSGGSCSLTSKTDKMNFDLGAIADYTVSMGGSWYFKTDLYRGFNSTERVYSWDQWTDFILNDAEFAVIYLGLLAVATLIARRYCTFQLMDWLLMGLSVIISLTVQVIA